MGSKSFVHTTELKRDRQDMSDSVKILSGFSVANNNNNRLKKGGPEMQGATAGRFHMPARRSAADSHVKESV